MMYKGYKYFLSRLTILMATIFIATAYSDVPNTNTDPATALAPIASLSYTGSFSPTLAYNLLGEGGANHLRANGTVGFDLYDYNRLKFTAEYLAQDITYAFFSGNSQEWVNQVALGAGYQQDLNMRFAPQFDVSGYVSHAPSKTLSTISGTQQASPFGPINFTDSRRIAGSTAGGGTTGFSIHPWQSGKTGIYLNYDRVDYDQSSNAINQDAIGFGGTAFFNQDLTDHVTLGLTGAVRQPFNNYRINLNWNDPHYQGRWTFGAFGEYNDGKNTLPNTWMAGINLNYTADEAGIVVTKKQISYNNTSAQTKSTGNNNLTKWVSDPAVRMPRVLAITDVFESPCSPPKLISPIPQVDIAGDQFVVIDTAPHFSGSKLTFALISGSTGLSMNPITGVLSGLPNVSSSESILIVLSASNRCGTAQAEFTIQRHG